MLNIKSKAIEKHVLNFMKQEGKPSVFAYVSHHSEVKTMPMLKKLLSRGKRILVPKINVQKKQLEFYEIKNFTRELQNGSYGIKEPLYLPRAKRFSPAQGDFVLVPGVAFDKKGYRIGYGQGYYDRFLDKMPAGVITLGLCYEPFFVRKLPSQSYDRRVHYVATEKGIFETGLKSRGTNASKKKNARRKTHTKRAA